MKKFIRYYKPHWKLFVIDMICSFLISVCSFVYPFVTEVIMDKNNIKAGNFELILSFCGLLVLIYIVKAILNYIVQYWGHILGVRGQTLDFQNHVLLIHKAGGFGDADHIEDQQRRQGHSAQCYQHQ